MSKLLSGLLLLGVASIWSSFSIAENNVPDWFDIKSVEITRLSITDMPVRPIAFLSLENDCSSTSTPPATTTPPAAGPVTPVKPAPAPVKPNTFDGGDPTGGIDISQIINIGEKVWDFIKANKAVVTAKTTYANALPKGVYCWDQLESWNRPRSEVYRAVYKNGFGFEVVDLEFQLLYTYGGQLDGKGRYLTNATVLYRQLDVAWGFNLDADVQIPQVINLGKKTDPVAGMQMNVHWSLGSLNHIERTASFFVYGDGRPSDTL